MRIIGDSHTYTWLQVLPAEQTCWMGPRTAFKIDTRREVIEESVREYPDDEWYIGFGDIDCRLFIYGIAMRKQWWPQQVFLDTIERYQRFLYAQPNLNVLLNPPMGPSATFDGHLFYAPWEFRHFLTKMWNTAMTTWAVMHDRKVINIWPGISFDDKGLPYPNQFDEAQVHLLPEIVKQAWECTGGAL
jgi:hypothetical protein